MRRVAHILFVTHPEIVVDPDVPVPEWRLAPRGIARITAFANGPAVTGVTAVYASGERKARESAAIVARRCGLAVRVVPELHENDRSATGYLATAEFEATADRFFAAPQVSVRGWERAIDAQTRIVAAVREIAATDRTAGELAIVAHGGVGALLLCQLKRHPIDRRFDQPGSGGGNFFVFDRQSFALVHGWRPIAPRLWS